MVRLTSGRYMHVKHSREDLELQLKMSPLFAVAPQFKGKLLEFLKHVDPGRKVGGQKPLYLVLRTREGLCVVESLPSRIGSKGGACVSSISRWG